jgi:spore maturation protein CgeB
VRILITAPGPTYSTFDVFAGYTKALRALGHEVYTFDHHKWLRFYDITLGQWQLLKPELELPMDAARVIAAEHVVIEAVDRVPDAVLIVTAMGMHRRGFELLDRLCLPTAVLLTESPYEDRVQAQVMRKGGIDLAFTNERTSAPRLRAETGIETVYLPHAYDPERHKPRIVDTEYKSDVFFWGTLWPKRKALLEALSGLPRTKLGGIWPYAKDREEADANIDNVIANEDMPLWYSGTKIALNHHREFCTVADDAERYLDRGEAESLGPRAYEIAACGAFQLCDDTRAELGDIFGDSVATYADADDLLDKVRYYLEHDRERHAMAQEARRRVQRCTFEARAESIVVPALEQIATRR